LLLSRPLGTSTVEISTKQQCAPQQVLSFQAPT